ncbi:MAG: hypothetical protein K2P70_10760 [Hyphomonadaceae bacterium]|nr:hypothetical protein [Hyphomonadaceae bacterium]
MIRETLERGGVFFAGAAALVVFLALCIEPLRGDFARFSAAVLAIYAGAFFFAMVCDGRLHRVLTAQKVIGEPQPKWFDSSERTTTGILRFVLFAEFWLALFVVGFYTATLLAAASGFAIVVSLTTCEYVRGKQQSL